MMKNLAPSPWSMVSGTCHRGVWSPMPLRGSATSRVRCGEGELSGEGLRERVPEEAKRNGSRPPAPTYPAGYSARPASCPHPARRTVTPAERGGFEGAQGGGGGLGGRRPPRVGRRRA